MAGFSQASCVVLTLYVLASVFVTAIVFVVHVYPDQGQSVFLASIDMRSAQVLRLDSPAIYK
jgi:hypothetical protein